MKATIRLFWQILQTQLQNMRVRKSSKNKEERQDRSEKNRAIGNYEKNEEEEEDKTLTGLENKILEPGTSRVKMSNREPQWFIWNFCSKLRIN